MIFQPSKPGDEKLVKLLELYPNNCYIFFYALEGAHKQGWEKSAELARHIQDWCEKQRRLITVGEE